MFDERTKAEIKEIALQLNVAPAALMAVVEVESGGRLLATIRGKQEPLIRFEGHYFDRFLKGDTRLEARSEGLADPRAGAVKNPRSQARRWTMLNRAIKINRIAALSSVSWGCGQVMGAHWQWLGYGSVDALVVDARSGVEGQVRLMVRYIKKAKLIKALQERDWTAFARTYNGPGYRKNRYDSKLQAAFIKFSKLEAPKEIPPSVKVEEEGDRSQKLMFGARGQDVKDLQRALTRIGYVLVADGIYGLVTDRVVRQFQRDHLLPATGIIGSKELSLIFGKKFQIKQTLKDLKASAKVKKDAVLTKKKRAKRRLKRNLRGLLLSISNRFA